MLFYENVIVMLMSLEVGMNFGFVILFIFVIMYIIYGFFVDFVFFFMIIYELVRNINNFFYRVFNINIRNMIFNNLECG